MCEVATNSRVNLKKIKKRHLKIAPEFRKIRTDNRPHVNIEVYEKNKIVLLDSGAMQTVITDKLFNEFKHLNLNITKSKTQVVYADNANVERKSLNKSAKIKSFRTRTAISRLHDI